MTPLGYLLRLALALFAFAGFVVFIGWLGCWLAADRPGLPAPEKGPK